MRHLTPSPRVLDRVGLLAAGGAMVIAASVVLGWLTPMTFLLLHVTSGPPTVLWVAATNLLAAAVVLTHGRLPKPLRTKVVAAAGAAIVMLSLLSLVELLTGWDVGLDFVSLHAAVEWANEHPGRASPYASAAMLMLGVAMLSLGVPKRVYARLVALVAIVALGGVGLGGLVVYVLHIEFLNVLPHQTGLAATTALVFVLLGIALLVAWTQADRPATFALSDFQKINLLAFAALTLVALVIGIGALAIMQRQMVSREQSFMLNLVQAQRQAMDAAMTGAITQAQKATRSVLGADAGDPESPSEAVVANLRDSFAYGAHAWLEQGYSSVRWMSPSGALVMGFGRRLWANARVLPVHAVVPASLNWDQGYYLEASVPLVHDGVDFGVLEFQRPFTQSTQFMAGELPWQDAKVTLCGHRAGRLSCLMGPDGVPMDNRTRSSEEFAPEVQSIVAVGLAQSLYPRSGPALVAYGPVGHTGLGLSLAVPSATMYAPARAAMAGLFWLILVTGALGVWTIQRAIRPLTGRLSAAMRDARENLQLFLVAAQSAQDSFLLLKAIRNAEGTLVDFQMVYVNDAGLHNLGKSRKDVVGKCLLSFAGEHPGVAEHVAKYAEVVASGTPMSFDLPCVAGEDGSRHISRYVTKVRDGVLVIGRDMTERVQQERALSDMAMLDELTGLPNRRMLQQHLARACNLASMHGSGLAVAFCDLDDFKQVNDRWGHACGDSVLIQFASILQSTVRRTDTVARLSGDEFVLVMENLGSEGDAHTLAETLRAALDTSIECCGHHFLLRASVGFAYAQGRQAVAEGLLARADAAMYAEKQRRQAARGLSESVVVPKATPT